MLVCAAVLSHNSRNRCCDPTHIIGPVLAACMGIFRVVCCQFTKVSGCQPGLCFQAVLSGVLVLPCLQQQGTVWLSNWMECGCVGGQPLQLGSWCDRQSDGVCYDMTVV